LHNFGNPVRLAPAATPVGVACRAGATAQRLLALVILFSMVASARAADAPASAEPPAPPTELTAEDHPWDKGAYIDLQWELSADDVKDAEEKKVLHYKVFRSGEENGYFKEISVVESNKKAYRRGTARYKAEKCIRGEPYYFRVVAVGPDDAESAYATAGPAVAGMQWFDGERFWLAIITTLLCGAVIYWISHARKGKPLKIRKIAGLEVVDEAVGRATEMGRSCMFIPGIQDMNDIQTIAGLTILARVSRTAAEYDAAVEVPTSKSLVMTAARETVQAAFLTAGRPDAYREDLVYYVTDEQFGYVAYLTGMMVREKPAACFYFGSFFAESLILAETGNAIGAIQVAGTAQPAQLPFFVAACDYTLIGEEFFAASAYLSGEPEQLGSLKGQDVGKLLVGVLLVFGCAVATAAAIAQAADFMPLADALDGVVAFMKETMLK